MAYKTKEERAQEAASKALLAERFSDLYSGAKDIAGDVGGAISEKAGNVVEGLKSPDVWGEGGSDEYNQNQRLALKEAKEAAYKKFPKNSQIKQRESFVRNYIQTNFAKEPWAQPISNAIIPAWGFSNEGKEPDITPLDTAVKSKQKEVQASAPGLVYREAPVAAQKVSIIPESVKKGLNTFSEAYANLDPVYRDVKTSIGVDRVNARKMDQEAGKISEGAKAITPKIEEAGAKTAATAFGIQDMKAEVQALLAKQAAMKASNAETMAKEDAAHQANLAQQAKWADERNVEAFREQQAAPDAYRFQAIHPWHGKGWVSYVGGLPKVGPTQESASKMIANYSPTSEDLEVAKKKVESDIQAKIAKTMGKRMPLAESDAWKKYEAEHSSDI